MELQFLYFAVFGRVAIAYKSEKIKVGKLEKSVNEKGY
jgi:hypothetical protein